MRLVATTGAALGAVLWAALWTGGSTAARADAGRTQAARQDWPMFAGAPDRNAVSGARGLPEWLDAAAVPRTGDGGAAPAANLKWTAALGSQTYAGPVLAGGRIYVGINNAHPRDPNHKGDRSILACFRADTGRFLWQLVVPKMKQIGNFNADGPGYGTTSTPAVDGRRVYVVTGRGDVVCLDANGLADGNDGPFLDEADFLAVPLEHRMIEEKGVVKVVFRPGTAVPPGPRDADILWRYDPKEELKVWPQDTCSSSPLVLGDLVYVGTSNGVDRSHKRVPSPRAPMLIALNKLTGTLVAADDSGIGANIFHGQWSSPSTGVVNGRALVFYGGGDGVCYAFDARPVADPAGGTGVLRTVWRCDANPADYRFRNGKPIAYRDKAGGPSEIIATPVFHDGRVYVTIGEDPHHRAGHGCVTCIDAAGAGDITTAGVVWRNRDVGRSMCSPVVADGLVYVGETLGRFHCIDARSGRTLWTHTVQGGQIWGSALLADGKVYQPCKKPPCMLVFAHGRDKKLLCTVKLPGEVSTTPAAVGNVLYLAGARWLYAVAGTAAPPPEPPPDPRRDGRRKPPRPLLGERDEPTRPPRRP